MKNKTWKRELGVLFAAVLCYEIFIGNTEMVDIIIWPFVTFIAASAGLHIYDRVQRKGDTVFLSRRRGSEHSS